MGMGAKNKNNEHQRIYTFILDDRDEDQKLLMKWLETQSTKKAVLEGLKLVSRGYNTVSGAGENTKQSEQISQLIHLLSVALSVPGRNPLYGEIMPQIYGQVAPQPEQTPPTEEPKEEPNENQWKNAGNLASGIDLSKFS